jgi:serine/threonine protein kinase
MPVGLTENEWRRVLELSEAVASLSFGGRLRFLESASISPEIIAYILELTTGDGSLLELTYGVEAIPELHLTAGLRIGRFTTIECLGVGGMGEVWSAHDSSLDRMVALKFFFPGTLAGLTDQQITREARAASALNHPNIVTIHEIVQSETMTAMVMELVDGAALRHFTGQPLPESEFLRIGFEIAEALSAAHSGGIIHGDIKPENILVRRDGHSKVLDFGLARRIAGESGGTGFVGTLRYMSPEQTEGEQLTPATDIFSLGLVLFELITGKHPFPSKSPVETATSILSSSPPSASSINPEISKSLDAFLAGMLARDPAQRPSANHVAQFLRAEAARRNHDASSDREIAQAAARDVVNRPPSRLWNRSQTAFSVGVLLVLGIIFGWIELFLMRKSGAPENLPISRMTVRPLASQPGLEDNPSISPDGLWISCLYRARAVDHPQLQVHSTQGGPPVVIETGGLVVQGPVAWSPDSSELAFAAALQSSLEHSI